MAPTSATPTGLAVYVDPEYLRCAFCDGKLTAQKQKSAAGPATSISITCENQKCPAFNMMGEVPISNIPSTRHRQRAAR